MHQELKLTPNEQIFLTIAKFTLNKRHRDMVGVLARLEKPKIHLVFEPLLNKTQQR